MGPGRACIGQNSVRPISWAQRHVVLPITPRPLAEPAGLGLCEHRVQTRDAGEIDQLADIAVRAHGHDVRDDAQRGLAVGKPRPSIAVFVGQTREQARQFFLLGEAVGVHGSVGSSAVAIAPYSG